MSSSSDAQMADSPSSLTDPAQAKRDDLAEFSRTEERHLYPAQPSPISPRSPDGHFGGSNSFSYTYRHNSDGTSHRERIPEDKQMPARTSGRTVEQVAAEIPRYKDWADAGKPKFTAARPKSAAQDTYYLDRSKSDEEEDEWESSDYSEDEPMIPPIAVLKPVTEWKNDNYPKAGVNWIPPKELSPAGAAAAAEKNQQLHLQQQQQPQMQFVVTTDACFNIFPASEDRSLTFIEEQIDRTTGIPAKTYPPPRSRKPGTSIHVSQPAVPHESAGQFLKVNLFAGEARQVRQIAGPSRLMSDVRIIKGPASASTTASSHSDADDEKDAMDEDDEDDDEEGDSPDGSQQSPNGSKRKKQRKTGKFKCEYDWCKQTFTRRGDVSRHMKTAAAHRDGPSQVGSSHRCRNCNADLSRSDARARHERAGACGKRTMPRRGGMGKGKFSIHTPVQFPLTPSENLMDIDG